jgi:hypothetical protein
MEKGQAGQHGSQSNGGTGGSGTGVPRHGPGGLCGGNCSWCLQGHS